MFLASPDVRYVCNGSSNLATIVGTMGRYDNWNDPADNAPPRRTL